MKKMLFLTRKYPPSVGGMENGLYQIAKNLPDSDLEVHVVALGKKQINLIWFFPYIVFYTFLHAREYDYLFMGDGLICFCGKVAKLVNHRIKRIIIMHGLDITYPNWLYQLYLRLNLRGAADIYACNSHYTEKTLKEWGISSNDGACTIVHGIDCHKYDDYRPITNAEFRKKYSINSNELIILTSGRLVKRKGVEWFIRNVFPQLDNAIYLVVGDGEERDNIEAAIAENQLDAKVRLLGRITDQELVDCYFNSDVFVMPNIHIADNVEGFGLVALEASLAGALVVAADVDGIPDAVLNHKNGILVASGDEQSFIQVLNKISDDKEKYRSVAEKYQGYTKANCSWGETSRKIKAALQC